jgi:hypothetical protein
MRVRDRIHASKALFWLDIYINFRYQIHNKWLAYDSDGNKKQSKMKTKKMLM